MTSVPVRLPTFAFSDVDKAVHSIVDGRIDDACRSIPETETNSKTWPWVWSLGVHGTLATSVLNQTSAIRDASVCSFFDLVYL